jgi:ATP-binding cassette subfamily F protein uup
MAPPPPLLALRDARAGFGGAPLFDGVSLAVGRGDRSCLVGRNGSGKSTLLKVLAGAVEPDSGERFVQPGMRLGWLPQDPVLPAAETVAEYVAGGLPADEAHGAADDYRVAAVLDRLKLGATRPLGSLSGGEGRRAALARTLVSDADVLLLDEPTNHLDLPTIEWLEEELAGFAGGIVMISHDRAFLRRVTTRTLWLERGSIRALEEGFAGFEAWQAAQLEAEETEAHKLDRKIAMEMHWLARGVTARRKRNEGRLARLKGLRKARAERIRAAGRAKLALEGASPSGELVVEAENVVKRFGDRAVIDGFSTRILRGDRVGFIGPNGAGKTTLLKLLTGQLQPDEGSLRLGTNVKPLYFDQRRAQLDPQATLWQTLAPTGGDSIVALGRQRHVVAYLRDFLFDDRQATMPVASLSGGERARLLLAKLFAEPGNLVVLDEPTNDLDMETLDLLQEVLEEFEGTLLLVSHDRDFLDRLVTSVIAVEGDGRIAEYPGGHADYLRQRPSAPALPSKVTKPAATPEPRATRAVTRLSYKEARELETLPATIDSLTDEIAALERKLADPQLYGRDRAGFDAATVRLEAARHALAAAEERWLELEEKRESLAGTGTGTGR